MGSGVNWLNGDINNATRGLAVVQSAWSITTLTTTSLANFFTAQAYRPASWNSLGTSPEELVYVRTNIAGYFFDAVIRAEHTTTTAITEHPIQNGANVVDHAFDLPDRLTLEIGMSDAMDSFIQGQYQGVKSIAAYQALKQMQKARLPLTVVTRLNLYENMLIEHMHAPDDVKTANGLRAVVTLRQIPVAQIAVVKTSVRPQTTKTTNKGTVQAQGSNSGNASLLRRVEDWIGGGN